MPIYEYRCERGHTFEAFQPMAEDPLDACTECDAAAQRVLSAPAVHFKGSGFYTTDYAKKKEGGGKDEGSDSKPKEKASEGKQEKSSSGASSGSESGSKSAGAGEGGSTNSKGKSGD